MTQLVASGADGLGDGGCGVFGLGGLLDLDADCLHGAECITDLGEELGVEESLSLAGFGDLEDLAHVVMHLEDHDGHEHGEHGEDPKDNEDDDADGIGGEAIDGLRTHGRGLNEALMRGLMRE